MGDDLDLDRFDDSDSEPAAEPGGDRDRDAPASSRPASSTAAGTAAPPRSSKADRLRAKKAAARAAQKARRREERERFPARTATDDADDDANDDARGARPADDKTHHGTLTVEGVVVDDVLVLLDRKSGAVYDGERRARDGSHLRIGTWDPAEERVVPLPERDVRAQLEPPKPKKRPTPDDDDPTTTTPTPTTEARARTPRTRSRTAWKSPRRRYTTRSRRMRTTTARRRPRRTRTSSTFSSKPPMPSGRHPPTWSSTTRITALGARVDPSPRWVSRTSSIVTRISTPSSRRVACPSTTCS